MGKGDKKTAKGKIFMGSYGNTRPKKKSTGFDASKTVEKKEEVKAKPVKKAAPKAETAKKTTAKKATKKTEE
jgi:30S ribosomal protein S31